SDSGEVELLKGSEVKVMTDARFRESCSDQLIWLDYSKLTQVVRVGGKIFIDDGLISLRITEIGMSAPPSRLAQGGLGMYPGAGGEGSEHMGWA
ncbi:hypothetical protein chiPu_0029288, partial [Chiloscyllium punctatum]|nr:hypothetical protein [Chiloscyllium punctatum]